MKIKSSRRLSKKMIVLLIVIVLLATGAAGYFFFKDSLFPQTKTSVDYSAPTDEEKQGEETTEQTFPSDETGTDEPNLPPDPNTSTPSPVGVEITAANQNGSTLMVRALIQTVESGGTCTLKMERNGHKTTTLTAPAQPSSSSTTCQGFNVDVAPLAAGEWDLVVEYSSKAKKGKASQKVVLQ